MDSASIMHAPGILTPDRERIRPALELVSVVGLLELELWYLRLRAPAWLNALTFLVIVAIVLLSQDRRRKQGQVTYRDALGPIWSWVAGLAACVVLSGLLVIGAKMVGDSNETFEFVFLDKPPLKLANWLLGKFGAALAQQLALQMFLWPVCFELTRSRRVGAVLAASIFGLIHLPSLTLVAITMLGGIVWISLFQKSGRLGPLILCHMILATLAHGSLPERLTYDMRVGISATADMKRFEYLNDPKARVVNRRLKDNRAELLRLTSTEYYEAQGGNMAGFIRGLIRDTLGRKASPEDLAFWLKREVKHPRQTLPKIFLASDEAAQLRESRQLAASRVAHH
ncbi:CPBP family intramembrane glutamic endopeptidase [Tundrisphaera lichenicola]|uniref:CPBP family intramembrane glutamic endopeptidase n=1 Tax=Tundrisphaera lichenicola TaxID=2029860 RepID=UPI003EBAFFB7